MDCLIVTVPHPCCRTEKMRESKRRKLELQRTQRCGELREKIQQLLTEKGAPDAIVTANGDKTLTISAIPETVHDALWRHLSTELKLTCHNGDNKKVAQSLHDDVHDVDL